MTKRQTALVSAVLLAAPLGLLVMPIPEASPSHSARHPAGWGLPDQQQQQAADTFAYALSELQRTPSLLNATEVQAWMERLYPPELQAAGIGATVLMGFVIRPDGVADSTTIRVLDVAPAPASLSQASISLVRQMRFQPGVFRDQPVRVLIQMPITWRPRG